MTGVCPRMAAVIPPHVQEWGNPLERRAVPGVRAHSCLALSERQTMILNDQGSAFFSASF